MISGRRRWPRIWQVISVPLKANAIGQPGITVKNACADILRRRFDGEFACGRLSLAPLLAILAADDQYGHSQRDIRPRSSLVLQAGGQGGNEHIAQISGTVKRARMQAMASLARQTADVSIVAGQENGNLRIRYRARIEKRRHKSKLIILAAVAQTRVSLKGVPDGAQTLDVLAHASGGVAPGFAVGPPNMRRNMAAQAKHESAVALAGQVPGELGRDHRAAEEGRLVSSAEQDPGGFFGGDGQQEIGIMRRLGNPGRVKSQRLRPLDLLDIPAQVA